MTCRSALALAAALLLLCAISCSAKTVYVKWDSPGPVLDGESWNTALHTVQAGLDTAMSGDEVWVAKGIYPERITLRDGAGLYGGFIGTETSRDQRDYSANVTVLEGNLQGYVVTGPSLPDSSATIDGFTIRNGRGGIDTGSAALTIRNNTVTKNVAVFAAGICCRAGNHILENNRISENTATEDGGGVYCEGTAGSIHGNIITANTARRGSAIYLHNSSCRITDNRIVGNRMEAGVYPVVQPTAAVDCDASSPQITGNTISGTVRDMHNGAGDAICCVNGSSPLVSNNVLTANGRDGVQCLEVATLTITDNTISHNTGTGVVAGGSSVIKGNAIRANLNGGVVCRDTAVVANNLVLANDNQGGTFGAIVCYGSSTIANNSIVGNSSASQSGAVVIRTAGSPVICNNLIAWNSAGINCDDRTATPVLRNNCLYCNMSRDYYFISPGEGDFSADPLLASKEYGNMHIQPGSPCIDAGWDAAPGIADTDVAGQPRVRNGRVDIGAYEADGTTTYAPGPYAVVHVRPDGDDSSNGSTWALAKRTLQSAIYAASDLGGEVWVRRGTYHECVSLSPFAHMYGGFGGSEDSRSSADWTANETIIEPITSISISGGVTLQSSTLDGFTIRDAEIGVRCHFSSPRIANNRITGNSSQGVYCYGAHPLLIGNTVSDNASGNPQLSGIYSDLGLTLIGNTIVDNHGSGVAGYVGRGYLGSTLVAHGNTIARNAGRGISWQQGVSVDITRNVICDNAGAGVYADIQGRDGSHDYLVAGNVVARNNLGRLSSDCGGIYAYCSSGRIISNTLVGNKASALYPFASTVANNIIAFNDSGIGTKGAPGCSNCVYGNTYFNYASGSSPQTGNVDADPLFVDKACGNYHLTAASPCINVGWNDAPGLPIFDMDGQGRVFGRKVDIGADEYWSPAMSISDARYAVDGAKISGQDAIVSAAFDGCFYIEAQDRSSGIRVDKAGHGVAAGDKVSITGALKTNADGERCIEASTVEVTGAGSISPLHITSKSLGGGGWFYNPSTGAGQCGVVGGSGLNNIGLLVTTWGKVSYLGDVYALDLGADKTAKILAEGMSISGKDTYCRITGISSCYRDTDGLHPTIRVTEITPVR